MSVVYKLSKNSKYFIFSKGAPELLIEECSSFVDKSGKVVPINSTFRQEFDAIIHNYAGQCLRNILICYK
jgi:Ca2+ transporting ATPase